MSKLCPGVVPGDGFTRGAVTSRTPSRGDRVDVVAVFDRQILCQRLPDQCALVAFDRKQAPSTTALQNNLFIALQLGSHK
jgi:hypothetical protein